MRLQIVLAAAAITCFGAVACAQGVLPQERLDPTRSVAAANSTHTPVPEQYIWTAGDAAALEKDLSRYNHLTVSTKTEPHYFRYAFTVPELPAAATLYLAGPRSTTIYLNGRVVDEVTSDITHPLGMHVFTTDVTKALRAGQNVIAMAVVRGRGIVSVSNSPVARQQAFGEVLVAKIIPAGPGVNAPALLVSGPDWKSTLSPPAGWEQPGFDDASWRPVQTLGGIESSIDMFQWNADAGLYDWPGYEGVSPFLRHYSLPVEKITNIFEGRSHFTNIGALTSASAGGEFTVKPASELMPDEAAPSFVLDFGREVTGRIEFDSECDCNALVTVQYGESLGEAEAGAHYLGVNLLRIGPKNTGYGPKSGFRYVKVRFLGGAPEIRFRSIRLDGIYYPVQYQGSFESSDPLLNRIWETGAYTMHVCMQDDIWDAPKRDRGRWVGDLDVGGRVVNEVFADHFLMEDTMSRLIGDGPVDEQVNAIPGYSAMWVSAIADYYLHTGDKQYLQSMHRRLLELLKLMDSGFGANNLYVNPHKDWLFIDWAPELVGDTPETRGATAIEFYRADMQAAFLLRELGDIDDADLYTKRAEAIRGAVNNFLRNPETGTYGPRWQTNAMAILSGLATPGQYPILWDRVLSHVEQDHPDSQAISPYYNYYVVSAMAEAGHRVEALAWIRKYWGNMLAEGATTFWEAYDLRWPKDKPHVALQADGTAGYFISLAHGWSSGPTAWLMEQVFGINPSEPGFRRVTIRPDLVDLRWARGSEPTPNGLIKVDLKPGMVALDLPPSVAADVLISIATPGATLLVNGAAMQYTPAENNTRARITLDRAGHYEIRQESRVAHYYSGRF